ncbi:MAG: ParA family protein [Bifidobacteriaceae bacterium]|jgi:cellulose biosynthesis protein BcsQ|nr:ParA family protein [Bifidobacteriaceae bacterium]
MTPSPEPITFPDHIFTWIDLDDHMAALASDGLWPKWLHEWSAYWDSAEMTVEADTEPNVIATWLEGSLGPLSVRAAAQGVYQVRLDSPPDSPGRWLDLRIAEGSRPVPARVPRWGVSRITSSLADPLPEPGEAFPGGVQVVATHSFKGGVGRTLHAVALAKALAERTGVLLVDADLEAPGISWMRPGSASQSDFSFEDYLAILHASPTGSFDEAVAIALPYLAGQSVGGITVLPTRRDLARLRPPLLEPLNLVQGASNPYRLTESIAALADALGAKVAIVDLRAGISELSSPILLDRRVQKLLVTSASAQSLAGTRMVVRQLSRLAPLRSDDPLPKLLVTQYRERETEALEYELGPVVEELGHMRFTGDDDLSDAAAIGLALEPLMSPFREDLLQLPERWTHVLIRIQKVGLSSVMDQFAEDLASSLDSSDETLSTVQILDQKDRRQALADHADKLVHAEGETGDGFLATTSLRRLVNAHREQLPLCLVVGKKGAGKTFAQLQMIYAGDWRAYARLVLPGSSARDATVVPVLTSANLGDATRHRIDEANPDRNVLDRVSRARETIGDYLSTEASEADWRRRWLTLLARSIDCGDVDEADVESRFPDIVKGRRVVFVIDGIEDAFQEVEDEPQQQQGLRALITGTLDWLRRLPGGQVGLIVFVREDQVRAAFKQNSDQLLARYQDYALSWDREEAVRLAYWITQVADRNPKTLTSEESELIQRKTLEDLTGDMLPIWGEKMGTTKSRKARSLKWVLAVLSDFNGDIQARDVVRFLAEAADASAKERGWADRILTPGGMRRAVKPCGDMKIREINEEMPKARKALAQLGAIPQNDRKIPLAVNLYLAADQVALLKDVGLIWTNEEGMWMTELVREGLGFRSSGRGLPRVLGVAEQAGR